jgi:NAD-dependent SIR2 family protein deacetylase
MRIDEAIEVLRGRPIVALTGAGLSTDSGIPDYRGPSSPARTPMTFQEFLASAAHQRRYWARSHIGWERMSRVEPNPGHRALASLERAGVVTGLITQNVDGLHTAAGHREVVDLHGRVDAVVCLGCRAITPRAQVQARLAELNRDFLETFGADVESAPDGDADLDLTDGFRTVACPSCGGVLKPDVVFFGENVPKDRVERAYALVDHAMAADGVLLVAGSSLTVMSGLRFVKHAHKYGMPVIILNRGQTRGDELAVGRVDAGCSETLVELAESMRHPATTLAQVLGPAAVT